jgi:hypothetical protein
MTALVWPDSGLPKKRKFFLPMAVGRIASKLFGCSVLLAYLFGFSSFRCVKTG